MIPVPVYVLTDLLESMEDLCEVILPRLHLPNYAAVLRAFITALLEMPMDGPLFAVRTAEVEIDCGRFGGGGDWHDRHVA